MSKKKLLKNRIKELQDDLIFSRGCLAIDKDTIGTLRRAVSDLEWKVMGLTSSVKFAESKNTAINAFLENIGFKIEEDKDRPGKLCMRGHGTKYSPAEVEE